MSRLAQARQATKQQLKARVALDGPSGSGKTWSSLEWATVLADGGRILVVDTEHGSAALYADHFTFETIPWAPPYSPQELADTLKDAARGGYSVVVVDSLSHFWEGEGGTLDLVDAAAQKAKGNTWAGWKTGTPALRYLIDVVLASPFHVLATMRSKTEWILEKDPRTGKEKPVRVGMAPVMRAGVEYEFTLVADLDLEHRMMITKSRCSALADQMIQPGRAGDAAETFLSWLRSGEEAPTVPMPEPERSVADAKRAVLDLCGGDRDVARRAWDQFGDDLAAIEQWVNSPREDSTPPPVTASSDPPDDADHQPDAAGAGDNVDEAPDVDGTAAPANSGGLTAAQRAMHARVGDLVKTGVWPKTDADMYRKGVISAITAGATDSSHHLDHDAMSDVLAALDAIAAGDLEVHLKATGEWSVDPVRKRRAS